MKSCKCRFNFCLCKAHLSDFKNECHLTCLHFFWTPYLSEDKRMRRYYRTLMYTAIGSGIFLFYLFLFSAPKYSEKPCPELPDLFKAVHHSPHNASEQSIDCSAIMQGDEDAVRQGSQYTWCQRADGLSDYSFTEITKNCDHYKTIRGFNKYHVTEEERAFPIAFSILMYENVEQAEHLLQAIYRPHNLYCFHIDTKAPYEVYQAVSTISNCFDNVFIASNLMNIHWGEFSLLEAELSCIKDLWQHVITWKYYINLSGREFPLKTNLELVQILSAYNGANDIDGTLHKRPIVWTQFAWRSENWRTSTLKTKPPHGFLIAKGSTHVAASRAFINYALHDPRAQDLLEWMRDIRAPDEHFFPTLNHNPHLGVPGAYKGDPDLKWFYTRLKIWWNEKNTELCSGVWVRFICNLGVGDLARLTTAKQMFVNKIRLEQDPVAFHCLHKWYHSRSLNSEGLNASQKEFYSNLNFAKNHVLNNA